MSRPRSLPLRVAPVPGETLDSWLQAVARRSRTPLGVLMGSLGIRGPHANTPDVTVSLSAGETRRLAEATGLDPALIEAMTLRRYDGQALVLRPGARGVVRSELWARSAGSRYCPRCLAITDGRWPLRWRLTWVFACTRHRCLLRDTCPGCGRTPRKNLGSTGTDTRPGYQCQACGMDLRTASALPDLTDVLLGAQARIDTLLRHVENDTTDQVATAPRTVFTDLSSLGGWLLRRALPEDLARWSSQAGDELRDYQHRLTHNPHAHVLAPTDAGLVGVLAGWSVELAGAEADEREVIDTLRMLLRRGSLRHRLPPSGLAHWPDLSALLRSRFLHALDPHLGNLDRMRHRSMLPSAALPRPGAVQERLRCVPQILWPDWTIRLLPASGFLADQLRTVLAACLLLPDQTERRLAPVRSRLHPYRSWSVTGVLRNLVAQGHENILAAICRLATHLDRHGSLIDYQRRRSLITDPVITREEWRRLCKKVGVDPGESRRLHNAQRYLHYVLTGADLRDPGYALAVHDSFDRYSYLQFTDTLPTTVRTALAEHAAAHLGRLGIDEPVTWSPPAGFLAGLPLPGRDPDDIDLVQVKRLMDRAHASIPAIATRLGTSPDHIRLALEHIPRPAPPAATRGRVPGRALSRALGTLTSEYFQREYLSGNKRLREISAETGYNRRLVAAAARAHGINLLPSWKTPALIDEDYLREQYLDRLRSLPEIAAELGLSEGVM